MLRVISNRLFRTIGYWLRIDLQIGLQVVGSQYFNRRLDVDKQTSLSVSMGKSRNYWTFASNHEQSGSWCGSGPTAKKDAHLPRRSAC